MALLEIEQKLFEKIFFYISSPICTKNTGIIKKYLYFINGLEKRNFVTENLSLIRRNSSK